MIQHIMPKTRVVIVDDHPMMRDGTQALLTQHGAIEVVGTTGEGIVALRLVEELRPDVLILDVHLPDRSGVDVAHHTRTVAPDIAVLIFTGYDDAISLRALLQIGVQGYLRKTATYEDLIAAVQAVAQGLTVRSTHLPFGTNTSAPEPLTPREREVLQHLTAGRRNKEIALALSTSVRTVEFHVSHILEKMGAKSRTDALQKAILWGLTQPQEHKES